MLTNEIAKNGLDKNTAKQLVCREGMLELPTSSGFLEGSPRTRNKDLASTSGFAWEPGWMLIAFLTSNLYLIVFQDLSMIGREKTGEKKTNQLLCTEIHTSYTGRTPF